MRKRMRDDVSKMEHLEEISRAGGPTRFQAVDGIESGTDRCAVTDVCEIRSVSCDSLQTLEQPIVISAGGDSCT